MQSKLFPATTYIQRQIRYFVMPLSTSSSSGDYGSPSFKCLPRCAKKASLPPTPTPIQTAYLGHWERSTCIPFLEQTPKKSKEKRRPASENSTKAHRKQAFVLCLERSPRLEACVQLKCFTHSLCPARLSNDPEGFPNLRGQFGSFH